MTTTQRVSGNKIRDARLKAGLSQTQLANAIQTSERNIRRWESEDNAPRIDSVAAIARATKQDIGFFLIESDEQEAAPMGDPFRGSAAPAQARGGVKRRRGSAEGSGVAA